METERIPPPPPYTETDIYSTSSGPTARLTPSASVADHVSVASSVDEIIYTPPYSPASSVHQNGVLEDQEGPSAGASSATAYFNSRVARALSSRSPEHHNISVTSTTEPKDLPYPETLRNKDVTRQDWATFVNYLLPEHIVAANNDVADRKLRAELNEESLKKLSLGSDNITRSTPSEVDAQLNRLRQSQSSSSTIRLNEVRATISEWNNGFFEPRSVRIVLVDAESEKVNQMPGAWIPSENHQAPEGRSWATFGSSRDDRHGFRMGSMQADEDGFRIGNMLVAGPNGFSLGGRGGIVADSNGFSIGGRSFGRRAPNTGPSYVDPSRERHGAERSYRGRSMSHKGREKGKGRVRSSSRSSDSSSSSSSSSQSESSIGSLPEYQDLRDQELPIAKQSLQEWLSHPEQPFNRQAVQSLKRNLKRARQAPSPPAQNDMNALRTEVQELLRRFKDGKKAQRRNMKESRREIKAAKRAARREKKQERRVSRRSARAERRFDERSRRGCDRLGGLRGPPEPPSVPRYNPPFPLHQPNPPAIPAIPAIRGMPGAFPAVPPIPEASLFGQSRYPVPPNMPCYRGDWPFTRSGSHYNSPFQFSMPGAFMPSFGPSSGLEGYSAASAPSAAQIHEQALQMDAAAELKFEKATSLLAEATGMDVREQERIVLRTEAEKLEEEGQKYRREASRLRAEAVDLDGELARKLHEENDEYAG